MSSERAQPPLSMRRAHAQRRAARQRAAIADAWHDFEQRESRGELRVRQAVALTRQVASLSAFIAAGLAIRRASRRGGGSSWRGLLGRVFWIGLARRMMRRHGDGPGGAGTRR
jgi:hypothetical protein